MFRLISHASTQSVRRVSRARYAAAQAASGPKQFGEDPTPTRAISQNPSNWCLSSRYSSLHGSIRSASLAYDANEVVVCRNISHYASSVSRRGVVHITSPTIGRAGATALQPRHCPVVLTGDILSRVSLVLARDLSTSFTAHQKIHPHSGPPADIPPVFPAVQTGTTKPVPLETPSITSPALHKSEKASVESAVSAVSAVKKSSENSTEVVAATSKPTTEIDAVKPPKLPLMTRIKNEIVHYYHGFRLFGTELRISAGLSWRFLKGHQLTRREYRQLVRTSSDLFRLIPFLVIIIVPFLELTLPILLKLFPGMLPSTFEDKARKEAMLQKQLKMKIEMAKLLQDTMADAVEADREEKERKESGSPHRLSKAEFANFINTIRSKGALPSNDDIIRFSKLFNDEMTLDNLPRDQLVALCRLMEMPTLAQPNELLRFLLRMRLRRLKADDYMIKKEGVNTLTRNELAAACRARGMRAAGASADRLRKQLEQWLELSLNEEVPITLLLMSRAMYVPENLGAEVSLAEVMTKLPERSLNEAEVKASEASGRIDYAAKAKIVREEQEAIKAERKAKAAENNTDKRQKTVGAVDSTVADKATDLSGLSVASAQKPISEDILTKEDYVTLSDAIRSILRDKKILVEKEDLEELQDDFGRLTASSSTPSHQHSSPLASKPVLSAAPAVPPDAKIAPQAPIIPVDQQPLGKISDKTVIPITPVYEPPPSPKASSLAAASKFVEATSDKRRKVATERLKNRVNRMIGEINTMVEKLEHDHKRVSEQVAQMKHDKKDTPTSATAQELLKPSTPSFTIETAGSGSKPATTPAAPSTTKATMIKVSEIADVIRQRMQNVSDVERERRVGKLIRAMHEMDINHDGEIDAEHVVKVLTYIAREPAGAINLTGHQMALMIDMLAKEEYLDDFKVQERVEDLIDMEEAEEKADAYMLKQAQEASALRANRPASSSSDGPR